jgi:predicted dehydrogenase
MSTEDHSQSRRPLRSLHAGVGNRGTWPLTIARDNGFEPVALCDVNADLLEQARQKTGLDASACFTNFGEALASGGFDCVIICSPTAFHVPMSIEALTAGYPVIVEKGMAPDWAAARKLVATVEETGVPLVVAQNYRFGAVPQLIKRSVTDPGFEAYLGPVHEVVCIHNRVRPQPRTLTYPFASVWDMSCHHFDNLLF